MINRLRKTNNIPDGGGETVGFVAEMRSDRIAFNIKASDGKRYVRGSSPTITKTAAFTVHGRDDGKTFNLSLLAGYIVALPARSAINDGMEVTFHSNLVPTSGAGYAISPAAADFIAGSAADGTALTKVVDKDLRNTQATAVIHDFVTLRAIPGGWLIVNIVGVWAKVA